MRDEMCKELEESVREGMQILRGERQPSREFEVSRERLDVTAIRKRLGLSRPRFATMLGISARTVEGWEQGRRQREGADWTLLLVADRHPDAVLSVVQAGRAG